MYFKIEEIFDQFYRRISDDVVETLNHLDEKSLTILAKYFKDQKKIQKLIIQKVNDFDQ